jgi:hypothetical protein
MGLVLETREGFMNYLRTASKNITGIEWPDYVLRDWLYRHTKDFSPEKETRDEFVNAVKSYLESFVNGHGKGHWEYKELDVSIDIFTEFVQEDLKKKMGGFINPDISKDQQRHQTQQAQLEKQGVSPEPIIVVETIDGKYDLLEGWHRTTNALKKYGDYKQNAWVYVLDNSSSLNESFISDLKDKIKYYLTPDLDLNNKRQQKNAINAFQKLVDLIFKYTTKQYPVNGLEGIVVIGVQKQNWWGNYNDPKDKGKMIEFTVNMQPKFSDSVDYPTIELPEDYRKFEIAFQENARSMGLTLTSPIHDKDISDYKVTYKLFTFPRYIK